MFSPQEGYCYLKAKDVIFQFSNFVSKFEFEADKILNNYNFSSKDEIVTDIKKDYLEILKKHYNKQIPIWSQEVFDEFIDNIFFELSINKIKADEIYNQMLAAIDWLCRIQKLDIEKFIQISNKYKMEFDRILKTKDVDYLNDNQTRESDKTEFIKIWNLIFDDLKEFLEFDFSRVQGKLSLKDVGYFENIKSKLNSYKKTSILDELLMISSAVDEMNFKESEKIYDFIQQVNDDFVSFAQQNKILNEQNKTALIKRRIELFNDKNLKSKSYFKKLIFA